MTTRILISLFLLVSCSAMAQKTKYVGDYLLGKGNGDTLSGRLFVSIDSFKIIYKISIKNGQDYAFPVLSGHWDIGNTNEIIFHYPDGAKKTATLKLLNLSKGPDLLRITIGDQVFTRGPTKEQMQDMHH